MPPLTRAMTRMIVTADESRMVVATAPVMTPARRFDGEATEELTSTIACEGLNRRG